MGLRVRTKFQAIIDQMESLCAELQVSPECTQDTLELLPKHGVYVFYEAGQPMYVGRVGSVSKQTIRKRFGQHTRPSASQSQAVFAFRLLQEKIGVQTGHGAPLDRKQVAEKYDAEFRVQKCRVRKMTLRAVEIEDATVQTVFELYASLTFDTKYNSFETS